MPSPSKQRQKVSYTLYIASKSVLDTPYSVKKCLFDTLSVLSEVTRLLEYYLHTHVAPSGALSELPQEPIPYPGPSRGVSGNFSPSI